MGNESGSADPVIPVDDAIAEWFDLDDSLTVRGRSVSQMGLTHSPAVSLRPRRLFCLLPWMSSAHTWRRRSNWSSASRLHIAVTPSVVAVVFAPTVQSVPGLTFLPSSSATSLWIETLAVSGELVIVQTTSLPEFGMVTVPEVPVPEAPLIALSSTVQE